MPTSLFGAVLDRAELDSHFLQTDPQPLLQRVGRGVSAAAAGDESLDVLLEPELAQTRRAFVEVLTNLGAALVVDLTIEIEVDLFDDLRTRQVVRISAAHRQSASPSTVACSGRM